jgi:N-carbamoyl-L-amino-acid hydrolase
MFTVDRELKIGSWLDGAYGVILALEVARSSQESGGPPVAVV